MAEEPAEAQPAPVTPDLPPAPQPLKTQVVRSVPIQETDDSASATSLEARMKDREHQVSMRLKRMYAQGAMVLFAGQVVALNLMFFFYGTHLAPWWPNAIPFTPSEGMFRTFYLAVLGEVFGLGYIVTRSLFPGGKGFWESILDLFTSMRGGG